LLFFGGLLTRLMYSEVKIEKEKVASRVRSVCILVNMISSIKGKSFFLFSSLAADRTKAISSDKSKYNHNVIESNVGVPRDYSWGSGP
jgi:hypothetical protein